VSAATVPRIDWNVATCLDYGVELAPNATAFMTGIGGSSWTYRESLTTVKQVGAKLRSTGIRPGDRVGILSTNSGLAFLCGLAVLRVGAVWAPLSSTATAEELGALLDLLDCTVVFYAPALAELVERSLGDRASHLAVASSRPLLVALGDHGRPGDPMLNDWAQGFGDGAGVTPRAPDDTAILLPTGGTTGRSKAVQVPHRALRHMTDAMLAHMPEWRPVQILAAPMTHAAGLLTFPVLERGGTTIVQESVDPARIIEAIEVQRATRLFLPPTAIYKLLEYPDVAEHDFSSLRYFIYAAAPMSVSRLRQAIGTFGPVLTQTFGQAEAPMIATFFGPDEHMDAVLTPSHAARLASCGRASMVARVAVVDERDAPLPVGVNGEIVISSELVTTGYLTEHGPGGASPQLGRRLPTGDIGYLDHDGYLYICDRKRDMIISGGFNVFPSEVERVLWEHPAVADCAVIGVPDDKWGERVTAIVELVAGHHPSAELSAELIAECRRRLGAVKTPKQCLFRSLPRSNVGKVLKRDLREQYWAGRMRAV
jgi:acyl-CoA synthetase (AMP-forming)/AMP-acid ligase II